MKIKKKSSSKNGRPSKKDTIDLLQLKKLAELGLTDKEMASVFGICEKTLNNYKQDDKFLQSLKDGKEISDNKVVKSLYRRALGYKYTETHKTGDKINKTIEKVIAPDTTACIFWLKNRQPDDWRDTKHIEAKNTNFDFDMSKVKDSDLKKYKKLYGNSK